MRTGKFVVGGERRERERREEKERVFFFRPSLSQSLARSAPAMDACFIKCRV